MGDVVRIHARISMGSGRGTSSGQGVSGQLSENHCIVRWKRPVVMSAPSASSANLFPSFKASELTVESFNCRASAKDRATARSCFVSDMPPVLVKLPRLSMGFLPSLTDIDSGYSTGMDDLRSFLAWIDKRKADLGISDAEISRRAKRPYAVQNIRRTVRNGHGSRPKEETVRAIAKALGNAPAGVLSSSELSDLDMLKTREAHLQGQLEQVRAAIALIEETRRVG